MSRWLIVLSMLLATAVAAAPAWTWVDENGQRHYSDRPVPGASQIEIQGAQGFPAPVRSAERRAEPVEPAAPPDQTLAYRTFDIVSPVHQQTLWNIGGTLNVELAIEPALQPGHRIDVYLDGQRVDLDATGSQLTIPDVFRGLHTLQAVILDANAREVLKSRAITIMVQQTSILNPNHG